MGTGIPFSKWTVFGNHFVIIDELAGPIIAEQEKSQLSKEIASSQYGVGCDDVIFVQRPSEGMRLEPVAHIDEVAARGEDRELDQLRTTDGSSLSTFRVFEPDGSEAAMCGDGLIAAAGYLRRAKGFLVARFITELPRVHAKLRSTRVAVDRGSAGYTVRVNFGPTERMPTDFLSPRCPRTLLDPDNGIERLESLYDLATSRFSCIPDRQAKHILEDFGTYWDAFLICTGEPHLVLTPKEPAATASRARNLMSNLFSAHRGHQSSWVVDILGNALNHLENVFPNGINVCVCRFDSKDSVVMRSFERGLLRETFACGTGAIAVAAVARVVGRVDQKRPVNVLPLLAQQDIGTHFRITGGGSAWYLEGTARPVFSGVYLWPAE